MSMYQKIWLVGVGPMGKHYFKVLTGLGVNFDVIGNRHATASSFEQETGCSVHRGGIQNALRNLDAPDLAIVAVPVGMLAATASALVRGGTKRILLEKPGALTIDELKTLDQSAVEQHCQVYIAYNRRFYESVYLAKNIISEDGGLLSVNFEFSEWAHIIGPLEAPQEIKDKWLIANSSHVIDLVFHLCGYPANWNAWQTGRLAWHGAGARFCGAGITNTGVMFSYGSDWNAPGRWGIELLTAKRRVYLRPLEEIQVGAHGALNPVKLDLSGSDDFLYKPGLYKQTRAFISGVDDCLCDIQSQIKNVSYFNKIAGYS